MKKNLIIGNSCDYHAVAVRWALHQIGCNASIWDGLSSEIDGQISLFYDKNESLRITMGGKSINQLNSTWYRRVVPYKESELEEVYSPTLNFTRNELKEAHFCLLSIVNSKCEFIVGGDFDKCLHSKSRQLHLAQRVGLKIPNTIITNNYEKAISFINKNGKCIIKPFTPHYWCNSKEKKYKAASTSLIDNIDAISYESICLCPCIFQKYIEKVYELRVTIIGDNLYAAKISKCSGGSFVDWRFHIGSDEINLEFTILPQGVSQRILNFVKSIGLKFGCLDLVVDINNDIYFLEINPSGQFLFIEQMIPEIPLLNAFASMLSNRSVNYNLVRDINLTTERFEKTDDFLILMDKMKNFRVPNSELYTTVEV